MKKRCLPLRARALALTLIILSLGICTSVFADGASDTDAKAKRFISLIASFEELTDIDDKLELLEYIKGDGVYFDDATYPGIKEAQDELRAIEAMLVTSRTACEGFIAAVDRALLCDENDYSALRAALDAAGEFAGGIDLTFDGVSEARHTYTSLTASLGQREEYTKEFISAVALIKNSDSYSDRLDAYEYALEYVKNEAFVADYPGVSEAEARLDEVMQGLMADIQIANAFISSVTRLGTGEGIALDILAAYAALVRVDTTVDGVGSALATLDSAKDEYNAEVDRIMLDFGNL